VLDGVYAEFASVILFGDQVPDLPPLELAGRSRT